jgi:hypothetical protein
VRDQVPHPYKTVTAHTNINIDITCCRQPQQMLSVLSMHATCFDSTDRLQTIKYVILKLKENGHMFSIRALSQIVHVKAARHTDNTVTEKQVKVKVTLEQATKAQRGVQVQVYYFFNLGARLDWVGGQRHAPAVLPPGKTRCPLYRWLGRPQCRSGRVLYYYFQLAHCSLQSLLCDLG